MNIIIQTCVPSYRLNFFNFITSNSKSVKIIAGKYFYSKSIVSDPSTKSVIWVKNYFLSDDTFWYFCDKVGAELIHTRRFLLKNSILDKKTCYFGPRYGY